MEIKDGREVFYLLGPGHWLPAVIVSQGPKRWRLRGQRFTFCPVESDVRVLPERIAFPDEQVCIVWQTDRGTEGAYHVERELYPEYRIPARNIRSCHPFDSEPGRVTLDGSKMQVWPL